MIFFSLLFCKELPAGVRRPFVAAVALSFTAPATSATAQPLTNICKSSYSSMQMLFYNSISGAGRVLVARKKMPAQTEKRNNGEP